MDACMDAWMDRLVDGRVDRRMNAQVHVLCDGGRKGWQPPGAAGGSSSLAAGVVAAAGCESERAFIGAAQGAWHLHHAMRRDEVQRGEIVCNICNMRYKGMSEHGGVDEYARRGR
eukprot:1157874-Pelagomonas_calceolata.AAC.5